VLIEVDLEPGSVSLTGADDFTRFHVSVTGRPDGTRLDAVLRATATGELDDAPDVATDALVRVDAVRRMAGRGDAPWEADFAAMLDFARSKGWLLDDGGSIRAHIEWD
jgi:hypothetical protein